MIEINRIRCPIELVYSMPRFRRRSRASVGRLIAEMKTFCGASAPAEIVDAACRAIPPRARTSALAAVAKLLTADGRLDRAERRFLSDVAQRFGLRAAGARFQR